MYKRQALALGALHDSLGYAIFFLAPLALACCASGLLLGGSIAAFLTQAPQGAPWRARTRVLIAICCALGIVALLVWLLPAFFGIGGAL